MPQTTRGAQIQGIFDLLQREFVYIWYYFEIQLRQIFGYWVLGILLNAPIYENFPHSYWFHPVFHSNPTLCDPLK